LAASAPIEDERLAVSLRVLRPDGSEQAAYRRTLDCPKGAFAADIPLGLNEHGDWSVEVFEPCTGKARAVRVTIP
jgi:hypothetical protein